MRGSKSFSDAMEMVEASESEIVKLCSEMVQIPTVSPPGESKELVKYIESYFDGVGVETEIHERTEGKSNICAKIPGRRRGKIVWLGHIDTVPPGDISLWRRHPFGGMVVDGKIYGRGSTDTKGAGAAAMVAAKIMSGFEEEERCPMDFWFTTTEEIGGGEGARWLSEEGRFHGDVCVIGDSEGFLPEEPIIDLGCKGALRVKLKAEGVPAHGSMPFLGVNAIEKIFKVWEHAKRISDFSLDVPERLEPIIQSSIDHFSRRTKLDKEQKLSLERLYHYPTVSLNIIKGGVKINIVPEWAEAHLDIRITPETDAESVKNRIISLVEESGVAGVEAEVISLTDGIFEDPESPMIRSFVDTVEAVTGVSPTLKIITGGTDGIHVRQISGIPCVGLAPGIQGVSHTTDEYVTIENLTAVSKIYAAFPLLFEV